MPWWQELIFWVLAFVAYLALMKWYPEVWWILLPMAVVGVVVGRIRKGR
jgi:hypothetical protein